MSIPIEKSTPLNLRPGEHEAFHWPSGATAHNALCVRYAGCAWSGAVSLEGEGDSSLLLRPTGGVYPRWEFRYPLMQLCVCVCPRAFVFCSPPSLPVFRSPSGPWFLS